MLTQSGRAVAAGAARRLGLRGLSSAQTGGDLPRDAFGAAVLKFANGDDAAGLEAAEKLAAARIAEVRDGKPTLEGGSDVVVDIGIERGLWLQTKVGEALGRQDEAFTRAGFKVGATNAAGQKRLGLEEPFYGELYRQTVLLSQDADSAVTHAALSTRGIEAEWAFILAEDLPPRAPNGAPYSRADVARIVHAVAPSIEVTATRSVSPAAPGIFLADGAGNGSVLLGAKSLWRDVNDTEVQGADAMVVTTSMDNEVKCRGDGTQVLGHPLEGFLWLCNRTDRPAFSKGDVILSGAANGVLPLPASSLPASVAVEFHGWGCLDLTIDSVSWVESKKEDFAVGAQPFVSSDL
ncbi:Hypothetical Protein FCC1311_030631 [Hondaea fermentalgiana]|uniref:Fumarylacetoacetase-like C-terminal domain-containing protein n=1 Tax=Hondaea fermentalgiana TaxID=2315210 RepID=A0A2R5G5A9_9STRA|nr:Hypothetical Protein FCC1311_030631 [Hondaea fermentalgiana]|eukprot:GBG25725.1 Hypothetical Protein FCC1311_030631 [Hondaea fermentalgiana]